MKFDVVFPGGLQVDARIRDLTVVTNQDGSAPSPFLLFLASLGTCAGIYVLNFCEARELSTEGVKVVQDVKYDRERGMVETINLDIVVPPDFPEKYHKALVRAADQCAVKKHLFDPPEVNVRTVVSSDA